MKFKGFELKKIKKMEIFSPEVWPELSRKFIVLTRRPKLYELRQHPHSISFCYVLGVQSKTWVCPFEDEKGRIYYSKKRTQLLTPFSTDRDYRFQVFYSSSNRVHRVIDYIESHKVTLFQLMLAWWFHPTTSDWFICGFPYLKFYLSCQVHAIDFLSDMSNYEAYDV